MGNRSRALVIALGIFFVGVAVLAEFYAYPALAVAPADQVASTTSTTVDGATVFVVAEQKVKERVTLTSSRIVRGDVAAAQKIGKALDRDVVVYDTAVVTDDDANYQWPDDSVPDKSKYAPLSFVQERVVLDAHTGEAIPWNPDRAKDNSGEYITTTLEPEDRQYRGSQVFGGHEGLVLKFPFGTEQKSYQFWDSTLRKAFPIDFKREDTLHGLKVYVFEQQIPKQEVPLLEPLKVPGSLVNEKGQDVVEVVRSYQNTRTLWIEPVTGAIIKGQEQQLATIDYEGEARITATDATIAYDEATVQKNVEGVTNDQGKVEGGYQDKAAQLQLIGFWVPLVSLIVGLLLLALVAVLSLRPRTARRAAA